MMVFGMRTRRIAAWPAASLAALMAGIAAAAVNLPAVQAAEIGTPKVRQASVCIGNETNFPIAFEYRWPRGEWTPLTQEPGETMRILRAVPGSDLEVRFVRVNLSPDGSTHGADHSMEVRSYSLKSLVTENGKCEPSRRGGMVSERIARQGDERQRSNFNVFRLGGDGRLDLFRVAG